MNRIFFNYRPLKTALPVLVSAVLLLCAAQSFAQSAGAVQVLPKVKAYRTRPLREIKPLTQSQSYGTSDPDADAAPRETTPVRRVPAVVSSKSAPVAKPEALGSVGKQLNVTTGLNFDGVFTFGARATPDTSGAVGATQYVQWVNLSFEVFDKTTGNSIYGPALGSTLWSSLGGPCANNDDGDIIAQYDKAAGVWVMSQHSVSGGPPFYQCVAVSQTSDATGSWNLYAFQLPTNFPDYPKLAVWPDAYYLTINEQNPNNFSNLGALVCALDRTNMLLGNPASAQCVQLATTYQSLLPSDLDGSIAPPAGSPNYLLNMGTNSLNLWKFHVDWTTPSNTTLTGPVNIPVTSFSTACAGSSNCVPQQGTNQLLDGIGDRLMYRLAYRHFQDGHESLVAAHTVSAPSGIRWYEIQNPGGTPEVFQQNTFLPDSNYRWMPSIGMDQTGDIAVGYSVSSSSMMPAIRYTGRAQSDPLNTMQSENSIMEGSGVQTGSNRWGDYSSMSIDPTDDCTFFYTNQYQQNNGSYNWRTRIASFKFPSCTSSPLVTVAPNGLFFGVYALGVTSTTQTVTVTNNQSVALNFTSISASGDFSQTNTCGSSIASLGSCTITVSFTPTAFGIRTGQVTISDDASGSPQVINMTGTGGGPIVSLGQTSLTFKSFPGVTTAAKTDKLTNTGSSALTISSVVASGDYGVTSTCVGTIAAGKACTINVTFTPSVTGTIVGEVTITSNAPGGTQLINLSGTGLTTLSVAPTSLTYATTTVGNNSATQTVTITNNASTSQTFTYVPSGNFTAVAGTCSASPVTLASAASCTIKVGFSPTINGSIKGAVTVTDTANGTAFNPQVVSLAGTGTGGATPALSSSPTTIGFGYVVVGSSLGPKSFRIVNNSASAVSILGLSASGDFSLPGTGSNPCVAHSTVLQPGKACNVPVTATPNQTGFVEGSVTITDNASSGPTTQVFGVAATGVWPVTLTPTSLTFTAQPVGTTSAAKTVTISNYSSSPVTLNSIVPSGDYAVVTGGSFTCGSTVAAASGQTPGTCTFGVTFTPSATGTLKGAVTVSHNAVGNNSPQIVGTTGTGQ